MIKMWLQCDDKFELQVKNKDEEEKVTWKQKRELYPIKTAYHDDYTSRAHFFILFSASALSAFPLKDLYILLEKGL